MKQKVSVIVPVYNALEYLPKCVESLKNQHEVEVEAIFIDDCSTDGSVDFLEDVTKKWQNAKLIKHSKRTCQFLARLDGLKICTGDFITWLDADDWVDESYYKILTDAIISTGADMSVGDVDFGMRNMIFKHIENPTPEIVEEESLDYLFFTGMGKLFSMNNKMIRREVLERAMPSILKASTDAEGINICEDNLYLLIIGHFTNKIVTIGGAQYHYVMHEGQSTDLHNTEKVIMQIDSLKKVVERAIQFLDDCGLTEKYRSNFLNTFASVLKFLKFKAKRDLGVFAGEVKTKLDEMENFIRENRLPIGFH